MAAEKRARGEMYLLDSHATNSFGALAKPQYTCVPSILRANVRRYEALST